ncbi:MAG TPA: CAP domain-containing protein [Candidatus Dormibacteraeota bacterium]|nr:CAP domain-containing protein [Candidatus Dormibacteraeota bacterium]
MSLRPASWLPPVAVAVLLVGGSVLVFHSQAQRPVSAVAQNTVRGATSVAFGATDIVPANVDHLPLPHPSPSPSTRPPAVTPPRAPSAPPPAAIRIGSYQQRLINQDRAAYGLRPLTWSSCLASVAASNAARLARQGWVPPYHTNGPSLDLGCHLGNQAGENVGYWSGGVNDGRLNTMFMNSPEHMANILGPYRYVATAWAVAPNGSAYIAVEFS